MLCLHLSVSSESTLILKNSDFGVNVHVSFEYRWEICFSAETRYFELLTSDSFYTRKNTSFDILFRNLLSYLESSTKIRYTVSPKFEKIRKIWLHPSMRRKTLGLESFNLCPPPNFAVTCPPLFYHQGGYKKRPTPWFSTP